MARPERMTFGVFLAPFHPTNENPTLAFERDLQLLEWLDALGYDEAFIGEHHSAGWETIASPEVFIAAAAQRTRYIRFGTGVVSIPYHHPFMVADRMVLLDHLTRGRVILGVGPGALATDAYMMGVDPSRQREMMDEGLGVIKRLFTETEPFSVKSDWFELNDGMLQIRPYQHPSIPLVVASVQTPAGVTTAGKHGAGVLSLSTPRGMVRETSLAELWSIAEQTAEEYGNEMRREEWRLSIPIHLAESREEAMEDVRRGHARVTREYFAEHPRPRRAGRGGRLPAGVRDGAPRRDRRHARRHDRGAGTAAGDQRRLRWHARARRGLGAAREDPAQLRAAGPLRDAALPGQRRRAAALQQVGARQPRADSTSAACSACAPRPRRTTEATPRPTARSPVPATSGSRRGSHRDLVTPSGRALPRPPCCDRMPGRERPAGCPRARGPTRRQAGR